jgi:predicted nuclease with TOPRIM domain
MTQIICDKCKKIVTQGKIIQEFTAGSTITKIYCSECYEKEVLKATPERIMGFLDHLFGNIEKLKQDVERLENNFNSAFTDYSDLRRRIDQLEARMEAAESSLKTLQQAKEVRT